MMKRNPGSLAVLAAGLIAVSAGTARADIKMTMKMTIDNPQMRQMMQNEANVPAQYRPMMEQAMNPTITVYSSGKKSRTDTMMMDIITDAAAGKVIMINTFQHSYSISKLDSASGGKGISGAKGGPDVSNVKVKDTGNAKTILGHKCEEFIITANVDSPQGGVMNIKDDAWSTKDFGDLPAIGSFGSNPIASAAGKISQAAGVPLDSMITMSGGMANGTSVHMLTTDISTDALPASTFEVPAGYTLSQYPMGGPGMGGMGGPGMGRMGGPGMRPMGGPMAP